MEWSAISKQGFSKGTEPNSYYVFIAFSSNKLGKYKFLFVDLYGLSKAVADPKFLIIALRLFVCFSFFPAIFLV